MPSETKDLHSHSEKKQEFSLSEAIDIYRKSPDPMAREAMERLIKKEWWGMVADRNKNKINYLISLFPECINFQNDCGHTALAYWIQQRQETRVVMIDYEDYEEFIYSNSNLEIIDSFITFLLGHNPKLPHLASIHEMRKINEHGLLLSLLTAIGSRSLNEQTTCLGGLTALEFAQKNAPQHLEYLLNVPNLTAKVTLERIQKNQQLLHAAKEGNLTWLTKLLNDPIQVDVHVRDKDNHTALDYAVLHGSFFMMESLLEKKASFSPYQPNQIHLALKSPEGLKLMPYILTEIASYPELQQIVFLRGFHVNNILHYVNEYYPDMLPQFLKNPNVYPRKGYEDRKMVVTSALARALVPGGGELMDTLLEENAGAGEFIDAKTAQTLLKNSMRLEADDVVDVILNKKPYQPVQKAAILEIARNLASESSSTLLKRPIQYAKIIDFVFQEQPYLLPDLIAHFYRLNLLKKDQLLLLGGTSTIFEAIKNNQVARLKLLLSVGADINAQDEEGNTPLMIAIMTRQFDMARFLLKAGADLKIRKEEGKGQNALDLAKHEPQIMPDLLRTIHQRNLSEEDQRQIMKNLAPKYETLDSYCKAKYPYLDLDRPILSTLTRNSQFEAKGIGCIPSHHTVSFRFQTE